MPIHIITFVLKVFSCFCLFVCLFICPCHCHWHCHHRGNWVWYESRALGMCVVMWVCEALKVIIQQYSNSDLTSNHPKKKKMNNNNFASSRLVPCGFDNYTFLRRYLPKGTCVHSCKACHGTFAFGASVRVHIARMHEAQKCVPRCNLVLRWN